MNFATKMQSNAGRKESFMVVSHEGMIESKMNVSSGSSGATREQSALADCLQIAFVCAVQQVSARILR